MRLTLDCLGSSAGVSAVPAHAGAVGVRRRGAVERERHGQTVYAHIPGGCGLGRGRPAVGGHGERRRADGADSGQRPAVSGRHPGRRGIGCPRGGRGPDHLRHLTAVRTPVRGGGHRGLRGRGGGRHVPADRLAHHRPDGRGVDTAGQAARRAVVRAVGKLAGLGHHLHQRARFRPDDLPGDRRRAADPHRVRPGRAVGGAVRPHPGPGERECRHRGRDRRRAQRGERDLSLGVDHADLGPVQPPEHRLRGERRHHSSTRSRPRGTPRSGRPPHRPAPPPDPVTGGPPRPATRPSSAPRAKAAS